MPDCVVFPVRQASNPVFYTTNIVLMPVIFGLGIMGNLLSLVVLNRSSLRRESPVYVYLTGLAVMDLLRLVINVPVAIRDMEVLQPDVTYSYDMVLLATYAEGFAHLFKHTATWLISFVGVVRWVGLRWPRLRLRWRKISASRVVVFLLFVLCCVLDFPRFFQARVVPVVGHCFSGMTLWHWQYTRFGSHPAYIAVYPWVVTIIGYLLPFFLLLVFGVLMALYAPWSRIVRAKIILRSPRDDDEGELQLTAMLLVMSSIYLLLELPACMVQILVSLNDRQVLATNNRFTDFSLIADCLSLMHCSVSFIVYNLMSGDFRKAFRRSFCCCCDTGDEYYEPVSCTSVMNSCGVCCCGDEQEEVTRSTTPDRKRKRRHDTPVTSPPPEESRSSSSRTSSVLAALYKKLSRDSTPKQEPLWI